MAVLDRLTLFVDSIPPLLSPEGAMLYGVGTVLVLIALARLANWRRSRTAEEPQLSELLDEETLERAETERTLLEDIASRHREVLAPAAVEWETRSARVGEQWTSSFYIAGYPDYPQDGYLSGLFELTDVEFDLTVTLEPKNQARARDELQNTADDLQADADLERSVRGAYLQERASEAVSTYKAVEEGQRVFDQGTYLTVRAESKEQLREPLKPVRATLREQPAALEPKTAICTQDLAIQSSAPVGPAPLGRTSIALGGAVGALLASPHNPTILESGGVEFGSHKDTNSPVVIDPFAREDGYAMFTVGDPGSGKSFGAKQNFIRTLQQDPDRIGVVLEPLNNWAGVVDRRWDAGAEPTRNQAHARAGSGDSWFRCQPAQGAP